MAVRYAAVSPDPAPGAEKTDRAPARHVKLVAAAGVLAAGVLVVLTLARFGPNWRGAAWSLAQVLLVFIACFDVVTRRIPNRVTLPAMAVVLALRLVFAGGTAAAAVIAGVAGFAAFLLLAVLTRGGFGMGDVKLAGLLGLLLGKTLVAALFAGVLAGGLASVVVVVARRGSRRQTIAYGPYLCLGGALAILAFHPLPLV